MTQLDESTSGTRNRLIASNDDEYHRGLFLVSRTAMVKSEQDVLNEFNEVRSERPLRCAIDE